MDEVPAEETLLIVHEEADSQADIARVLEAGGLEICDADHTESGQSYEH